MNIEELKRTCRWAVAVSCSQTTGSRRMLNSHLTVLNLLITAARHGRHNSGVVWCSDWLFRTRPARRHAAELCVCCWPWSTRKHPVDFGWACASWRHRCRLDDTQNARNIHRIHRRRWWWLGRRSQVCPVGQVPVWCCGWRRKPVSWWDVLVHPEVQVAQVDL